MRHAAHLAIVEADRQVRVLQGQGLVGAAIEHGTWEEEGVQPAPGKRTEEVELEETSYLYCRFELVGTAVARYAPRHLGRVQPVFWLNSTARPDPLRVPVQEQHDGAEAET
jgi:hypothetical protein